MYYNIIAFFPIFIPQEIRSKIREWTLYIQIVDVKYILIKFCHTKSESDFIVYQKFLKTTK